MVDQEFHGVKYQVPIGWTTSQKTDDDSIVYNSIYDGSLSDSAFVMVFFSDNENVSEKNEREKIDLWAYTFSESDVSNFQKTDCTICGRYSARLTFDDKRDGATYDMTVYTIPVYGRGILTLSITSKKAAHLDHQTYCDFILDSLSFPDDEIQTEDGEIDTGTITTSNDEYSTKNSILTTEQSSALKMAAEYLDYTAFSHDGLVDQLEYEGFSTEDATYAADNCGADWNEQAARMAQEYRDYSTFSHKGLVEQLEYEGFTAEQAEYGASATE